MRLVIVESPFAGDVDRNLRYLRACLHDCLRRGEAPFASHGLYTQPGVLDDNDVNERALGIKAGFEWRKMANATVFYRDLGMSRGMTHALAHAEEERARAPIPRHAIEFRTLGGVWSADRRMP